MKTKTTQLRFADLPITYTELCGLVVPRPIHDEAAYGNALEMLSCMAGFEEDFRGDQNDYFSAISDFIASYEATRDASRSRRRPLEMLRYLLDENGMTASDLSRLLGADRTLGAKILRGERNLTVPHLRILSERFKVDPSLFI